MKKIEVNNRYVRLGVVVAIIMLFYGCTKTIHDRRSRATQTPESRESFGFNLNGRFFKSETRTGNVSGSCTYRENANAGFTFRIQADHSRPECITNSIEIVLDSVELDEGKVYKLGSPASGAYLKCTSVEQCSGRVIEFTSSDNSYGYIKITRFRPEKSVIGGDFACVETNDFGETFQISDGYFDRHFTH